MALYCLVPPPQRGARPAPAAVILSFVTLGSLFNFSEHHRVICKNQMK